MERNLLWRLKCVATIGLKQKQKGLNYELNTCIILQYSQFLIQFSILRVGGALIREVAWLLPSWAAAQSNLDETGLTGEVLDITEPASLSHCGRKIVGRNSLVLFLIKLLDSILMSVSLEGKKKHHSSLRGNKDAEVGGSRVLQQWCHLLR